MSVRNPSKISTLLAVDDALVQDSDFAFDADDRQYLDNQILGIERHLVACLIRGVGATYVRLSGSSASVIAGDIVCLASLANATEPTATKCTAAALALASAGYGVVLLAAAPGSFVLVATSGALAPSLTGLATSSPGSVRIKPSTGRCERVAALAPNDYAIGFVDNAGWLTIGRPTVSSVALSLAANFTTVSTTLDAGSNTNLTFPVLAGEVWEVEFHGNVQCSSTAGSKFALNAPAASTIEGDLESCTSAITTFTRQRITAINTLTATAAHTQATTPALDYIWARIVVAVDGAITLRACSVNGAQTTTIFAGATLVARKLVQL